MFDPPNMYDSEEEVVESSVDGLWPDADGRLIVDVESRSQGVEALFQGEDPCSVVELLGLLPFLMIASLASRSHFLRAL